MRSIPKEEKQQEDQTKHVSLTNWAQNRPSQNFHNKNKYLFYLSTKFSSPFNLQIFTLTYTHSVM